MANTESINPRAEKAIAAYLRGHRDPLADDENNDGALDYLSNRSGAMLGLPIHEGRSTQQRQSPCVVVSCATSERPYTEAPWYVATVEITLITNRHEDENGLEKAEVIHNARAAQIQALIEDEEGMKAAVNCPPIPDEDLRGVTGFHLMGLDYGNQQAEARENLIAELFELRLFCGPFDAC